MSNSKLTIGISSRALFNLDESHKIFEKDDAIESPIIDFQNLPLL